MSNVAHKLNRKLNRAWRVVATAYCFAFFGVAAIVVSATVFPWLRITARDAAHGRVRIQHAMRVIFRSFANMMRAVGVLSYELRGLEKLRKPGQLLIANHPTLIDVIFLVSLLPEVDCIVKDELWRNPFLRWPVLWAGYIPNSTAQQLVSSCAQSLQAGRSLLVFPEGTRTVPGRPIAMRRGAAQIALAARPDILPITISCEPLVLAKTQAWHAAPLGAGHFIISVGEPIAASEYLSPGYLTPQNLSAQPSSAPLPQSLAARALTRRFEEYFEASLLALRREHAMPNAAEQASNDIVTMTRTNAFSAALNGSSLPISFTANDADRHANS